MSDEFRGGRYRIRRYWVHSLELLTIALSYLQRSRIARFISARLGLGMVVEVTDRFGAKAGHRLSDLIALLIAEPHLIAVLLTAIFVIIHVIAAIIRLLRRGRHLHHARHGHARDDRTGRPSGPPPSHSHSPEHPHDERPGGPDPHDPDFPWPSKP